MSYRITLTSNRVRTPPLGDRADVLQRVTEDGLDLKLANEELRDDDDVVLTAVAQDGRAISHASAELREDRAVVLAALQSHGWMMTVKTFPKAFRADRELVLAAVKVVL